ncbi:Vesicle tethering protein [Sesbania bispinosa]|nr:Vesicle tethering protein [Sesbania bispinosa]
MDLMSGYKGVVGLVFGNENSSNEDRYVERLLDRISNGKLSEDRRNAITELQAVVAESQAFQLAFGAMGFPIMLSVLKEERDDVEMVRGALETLVSALTPINHAKGSSNEVQPDLMNTDLLSREAESISLLLSLLEAILTIPRGITRLMDMLMDREVIRNEALLLLTHLTREAEEIQKIVVFEGAFEKLFSIIERREIQMVVSLYSSKPGADFNMHGSEKGIGPFMILGIESQWVPVAVRCAIWLYINALFDDEKQCPCNWVIVIVVLGTCNAMFGDLIAGDSKNHDLLASKVLGEEPQVEPALNSILRILLRTSSMQEFIAADYVFKSFKNADGQSMLASTLIPQPYSMNHAFLEEDVNMSFGSMLLHGLTLGENDGDLETCCRAASVLSHILKDNLQCKERVLRIEIEAPMQSLGAPEPLMHRMVKYLALASSMKSKDGKSSTSGNSYVQAIILKLLVTWLADCPSAVQCFLDARPHLTYLLELVSNLSETVCIRAFSAVILGECVIYNKSTYSGKDAFAIVDTISQKVGLSSYFLKFDEMNRSFVFASVESSLTHKSFTRSSAASMADIEDVDENDLSEKKNMDHPILSSVLDSYFVNLVKRLGENIREQIVEVYSHPKIQVAVVPPELERRMVKMMVVHLIVIRKDLVVRNATLAEDLAKTGSSFQSEQRASGGSDRVQIETLRRDFQEACQRLEMLKAEKDKVESEAIMYRNLAGKMEADLRSLSDAYNSLEQSNLQLENEVKALKREGHSTFPDVEAIKAEAREEALKESEGELNDLLVCLGQEQSKVDKLSARLLELGEDVDKLLEGIGDDVGVAEDGEDDEDTE